MPIQNNRPISAFTEKLIPNWSDYIPIVDTSDIQDRNKKVNVGNLFKGLPYSAGTASPSLTFGYSNNSGLFSPNGNEVGVRVGNTSNFRISQIPGSLLLGASDNSTSNLDISFQAYGNGKINFLSPVNISSNNFFLISPANQNGKVNFDVTTITSPITLSIPNSGGAIVTDTASQVLLNKTFTNTSFTGNFSVNPISSDLIVNNGKVGIGINAPEYKLHVANDVKISGLTPSIRLTSAVSEFQILNTNYSLDIIKDSTTTIISFAGTGITIPNLSTNALNYTNDLNFIGSGVTNVTLTNSGKFGIGITTPDYKLHVANDVKISGVNPNLRLTGNSSEFQIINNNSNSLNVVQDGNTIVTLNNSQISLPPVSTSSISYAGSFKFVGNGTTTLLIDNSGKIGIGVVPDYNLHVLNNFKVSGTSPNIRLTNAGSEYQIINDSNNNLNVFKSGNSVLNITGSGVSIPTSNIFVSSALNVINYSGTTLATINGTGISVSSGNISTPSTIVFTNYSGNTLASLSGTGVSIPTGNITYPISLNISSYSGNSTTFTSSGNVGIGTTNPVQLLDVAGGARINNGLYRPNGTDKVLDYNNTTNYFYANQEFRTGTGSTISNAIITSSGSVGIGTTNPTRKLHLYGDNTSSQFNAAASIVTTNNSGYGVYLGLNSTSIASGRDWRILSTGNLDSAGVGKFSIYDATANFDRFTIISSGNVGIGTTNPIQLLDVAGAARINSGLYRPNGTDKALDYDNLTTYHYSNQEFKSGSGTTTNVIITSSGNVGIGTTNPTQALDIVGSARINGGLYRPNGTDKALDYNNTTNYFYANQEFKSGSGTTTNVIITSSGNVGVGIVNPTQALDIVGSARISGGFYRPNGTDKALDYNNTTNYFYANQEFRTSTGSTIPNVIINSSGNIGIGNTNPIQPLDVYGSARISGGFYRPNGTDKALDYNNTTTYHYSNQEFKTGPSSVNPNIIITSLGNLGIGTTQPAFGLDIVGNTRTNGVVYGNNTYGKVVPLSISSGNTLGINLSVGTGFSFTLDKNINTIQYSFSGTNDIFYPAFSIVLIISHDGNSYTINWNPNAPSSYKILWLTGVGAGVTTTSPTLQTAGPGTYGTPSRDIITLTTYDNGVTFLGKYVAAIPAF